MSIKEIKQQMKAFKDFYGGDIMQTDEIDKAITKKELAKILWQHQGFMESMLCDATSHLDSFRKKIGLNNI